MGIQDKKMSSLSFTSRASRHHQQKLEAYNAVVGQLRDGSHEQQLVMAPQFQAELWNHFTRLPARYAVDVNVESPEDVLEHKKLLDLAKKSADVPVFSVRLIQGTSLQENQADLATDETEEGIQSCPAYFTQRPTHEVTFSTIHKPKLLNLLTSLLAELGLNIQEAHAFSTNDGYSLDVFLVDGWHEEETEQLQASLQKEIQRIGLHAQSSFHLWSSSSGSLFSTEDSFVGHIHMPNDVRNIGEIDIELLNFGHKMASGSNGNLYKGTYCSQDVAIKVLKPELVTDDMQREFAKEISIMRKVQHKNVVQFIGACTQPSSFFIITEFMSGGSLYDYLRKHKSPFKLQTLLRVAIDVSEGMNYLHQNNIIHRDLKSANLLMGDSEVVKVGDFGVARVRAESGIMTAETGTYRWMAPEVIQHKPYDHKADVFSFGIVLWELITAKIPYQLLTPLQAAVGVIQKLRPTIPKNTHPKLAELMERCWQQNPAERPDFLQILQILKQIEKEIGDESKVRPKQRKRSFLSVFKRGR